uniref:Uncharacterized protein n=1 Tax=Chromera velia CCMP2878 TaxID=1169474 RepID=A0A0G4FDQ8_9ALVE|eukprot:Cvel_16387.t1-p1 / transcript=Cvel_16387.t1 / gene=Cvel_16387 / organism=Chromera_velia_CCMP2878 / gene_product=hypothetical protein / transcript_product=hypothetical protein / location=Cvel_scaffold1260:36778-37275(-) / protein_length=166 / sequence_SO=supercontig / SO=protein_coding / is_pseudo=false
MPTPKKSPRSVSPSTRSRKRGRSRQKREPPGPNAAWHTELRDLLDCVQKKEDKMGLRGEIFREQPRGLRHLPPQNVVPGPPFHDAFVAAAYGTLPKTSITRYDFTKASSEEINEAWSNMVSRNGANVREQRIIADHSRALRDMRKFVDDCWAKRAWAAFEEKEKVM